MRMQEGSSRLAGTRTARKYQSTTDTQTKSGTAVVTAGSLWDTGKGPRAKFPAFHSTPGAAASRPQSALREKTDTKGF